MISIYSVTIATYTVTMTTPTVIILTPIVTKANIYSNHRNPYNTHINPYSNIKAPILTPNNPPPPYTACSLLLPSVKCNESISRETTLKQYANGTCYNGSHLTGVWDYALFKNKTGISRISPSAEYYKFSIAYRC